MEKDYPENHNISSAKDEALIKNKQNQIAQGACQLFFNKGYHPTTIREIAEACDMSMGQLYHYISSKDDVLYLVHKHFHQIQEEFRKSYEINHSDDPVENFINFYKANLAYIDENKELIQFILTETKYLQKGYLKLVLEMESKYTIGHYRKLLEDINNKTPIKGDINILASIIAYVTPFLAMRGWTLKNRSLDDINENLLNFVFSGLGLSIPPENDDK